MSQKIAIIDYSSGNLHSVYKKIIRLKQEPVICNTPEQLRCADKIILPGVGHFGAAMQYLQQSSLLDALNDDVLNKKKPVLGICLGMQLMAHSSEESPGSKGLSWIDAQVVRFKHADNRKFRTPHTGWNQLNVKKSDPLLMNTSAAEEFYFTHAYHLVSSDRSLTSAETEYEYSFLSAISQEQIFGVQFHPEKSHEAGEKLFKSFLAL